MATLTVYLLFPFMRAERMMVCRRRWCLQSLIVIAGSVSPTLALAAVPTPPHSAKDFETAGHDLVRFRDEDLAAAPTNAQDRAEYARAIGKDFTQSGLGINSKDPAVRLNSAILIAQLNSIGAKDALVEMLSSSDPAVRFWAAKGLGSIARTQLNAGVAGPSIAALNAAAKKENDGVVAQEIIKTLIMYEAFEPILHGLENIASQIQKAIPDAGMLQAAATGLDAIAPKVAAQAPALKLLSATIASHLASYALQQAKANDAALKSVSTTGLSDEYLAAVRHVVSAATRVAAAAAGKTYRPPSSGSSVDELELHVNTLFGTAPGGTAPAKSGQLQADMKDVPLPDAVKVPATGPQ
jgi:hypothetical protein